MERPFNSSQETSASSKTLVFYSFPAHFNASYSLPDHVEYTIYTQELVTLTIFHHAKYICFIVVI